MALSYKYAYGINWGTYNNSAYSAIPITAKVDSIIDIDIANKTFKKDGVSYDASSYIGSDKATTPLLIWSKNNKLHYLQIDDEVSGLKYHLLPCTYMGEPGMYDIINKVFYGNANTKGSFTVAND